MNEAICVLVTGSRGFVGRVLVRSMRAHGFHVKEASRDGATDPKSHHVRLDLSSTQPLNGAALTNVDAIVHLAGRVHAMTPSADEAAKLATFNIAATERLAQLAASCGVRRFVFASSVKVLGESTPRAPFSSSSEPQPVDPYGLSKYEAELALWRVSQATGMRVAIVRSPLVYGPGVRANFLALMRSIHGGVPLPFALVKNSRSFVSVDNLADFILTLVRHESAPGRSWLVSDDEDLSTPELIRILAYGMGRPARLFPVPVKLLHLAATISRHRSQFDRICGSLQVDISDSKSILGWRPAVDATRALELTVHEFLRTYANVNLRRR